MPKKIPEIVKGPGVKPEETIVEQGRRSLVLESPQFAGTNHLRPHRPRRNKRHPSDSSVSILLQKRLSYVPVVSSPLKTDGNSSEGSDGSERQGELQSVKSRRRSLQIRVVETPVAKVLPATLDGVDKLITNDHQSQTPALVVVRNTSPALSLQSVGRDFSRYPSRRPSDTLMGSPPYTQLQFGLPFSVDSTSPGHDFDTADPERGFSPYIEERGSPIYYPTIDEKEDDDSLHNPDVNENVAPGCRECCSHCSWRFIFTFMCFIMLMIGPAILFIVWPIMSYSNVGRGKSSPEEEPEILSPYSYPILSAVRASMIDPDTPKSAMTRKSVLGQGKLKLVFSDEFNKDGRTFYENDDQFWQAVDLHYAATNDLEWYDPDAITTQNGTLQIRMQAIPSHNLDYRSGMLQSWNKLCFKGGVMEVSASLAGPAGVPGLWPGIWTLGNLARPGFRSTSDGVWPYSYNECDVGITPNQSSFDGISYLPGQKLAKCVCSGQGHPSPGTGRGAPEIDALEGTAEYNLKIGVVTQSSQVAPFDVWYRVDHDFLAIRDREITQMNGWSGGPYQQAISGVTMLNNDWYDGNQYQKYAFEYISGGGEGAIAWFVGDAETFRMKGKATGPNGNIGQRDVSHEPMSIILNLGISTSWTWIDWAVLGPRLAEGTTMYIDYVRIYQKEGEESITCDPPGYSTTSYINKHPKAYKNVNLTTWDDTGYPWPKNELMHGCD